MNHVSQFYSAHRPTCIALSLPPLTLPLVAMADVDKPVMPVIEEESKIITQVRPLKWRGICSYYAFLKQSQRSVT